jgi:hypothetical protein
MEKRWVNTNQPAINKAFMSYAKHTFSKYKGCDGYETYAEIDKNGRLAYVYEVSNHYQSSWTGRNEMTCENMCDYEELNQVVRFYVGLVVPRLKKEHVAAISQLVTFTMKPEHHSNRSDWYNTYGFDCRSVEFVRVAEIATQYLKDNLMYREKNEYTKKALPAV